MKRKIVHKPSHKKSPESAKPPGDRPFSLTMPLLTCRKLRKRKACPHCRMPQAYQKNRKPPACPQNRKRRVCQMIRKLEAYQKNHKLQACQMIRRLFRKLTIR
nr:hypothetical protein [Mitsuokella sp. oral taxon 131]